MKAIVTLANGHDNIVMVSKNNPDSAAIMLRSEATTLNSQGFVQTEKRVGLLKGKTEEIQKLAAGLKAGDDFSVKIMPVKLIIKESTSPAYDGHEPKINPQTKETVMSGGSPVYRQTLVVGEGSPEQDVLLVTDREEITASAAVEANVDFDKRS